MNVHQQLSPSTRELRLFHCMTLGSGAHHALASAPFSSRHSHRYHSSPSSHVRDCDLRCKNLLGLIFPSCFSEAFYIFPLPLMLHDLNITVLTDTPFPFVQGCLSLFLLQTDHQCNISATKLSKKTIKTPFPTFSCCLVACNTQGLLFQNLF